jgi:hypothetical protein
MSWPQYLVFTPFVLAVVRRPRQFWDWLYRNSPAGLRDREIFEAGRRRGGAAPVPVEMRYQGVAWGTDAEGNDYDVAEGTWYVHPDNPRKRR